MAPANLNIDPDKWVNDYGDKLYAYAYSRVGTAEIAEDLVQETFLSGLKSLDKFKGSSSEYTWLVSILKHKIIDHYRQKATRSALNVDSEDARFKQSGFMAGGWIKDKAPKSWSNDTVTSMESEEFMRILYFCIKYLPDKWASCFILRVIEEMPGQDVCKELDITSSNLWTILHRARLQLRDCLETNWFSNAVKNRLK